MAKSYASQTSAFSSLSQCVSDSLYKDLAFLQSCSLITPLSNASCPCRE